MTDTIIDVFTIEKRIENSNINRGDYPDLPDKAGKGRLMLFRGSPYTIILQLRTATDRVVQTKSANLDYFEAVALAHKLNSLAYELEVEAEKEAQDMADQPSYDTRAFCDSCGRLYKMPRKWWDAIDDHTCVCGEGVLELVKEKVKGELAYETYASG